MGWVISVDGGLDFEVNDFDVKYRKFNEKVNSDVELNTPELLSTKSKLLNGLLMSKKNCR